MVYMFHRSQVTFEVPAVGGRLVLVDMAGSENIEQAGIGMDARIQVSIRPPPCYVRFS